MNTPVTLPALGEAIERATISQWLKSVGDLVAEGEPLVEVSTDKVDTEIESPAAGVLIEIRIGEDDVAGVGDVIAMIGSAADASLTPAVPKPTPPKPTPPAAGSAGPVLVVQPMPVSARVPSSHPTPVLPSPVRAEGSRAIADLMQMSTTLQERVTATPSPLRGTTQNLTRVRKTIANRMLESLRTSAQLTTIVEVDVTEVGRVRRRHNNELPLGEGVKLSYLPFIAVAALEALRTYPQVNSSVDLEAGTITYPDTEHLSTGALRSIATRASSSWSSGTPVRCLSQIWLHGSRTSRSGRLLHDLVTVWPDAPPSLLLGGSGPPPLNLLGAGILARTAR